MSLQTRIMEEIVKHEDMIVSNATTLTRLELGIKLAIECGLDVEAKPKYDCRVGETTCYSKHSEYMIKLFRAYLSVEPRNIKKTRLTIIYKLIRDNAVELEEHISACVRFGFYTEGWYLKQMDNFKTEVNNWERLVNSV